MSAEKKRISKTEDHLKDIQWILMELEKCGKRIQDLKERDYVDDDEIVAEDLLLDELMARSLFEYRSFKSLI